MGDDIKTQELEAESKRQELINAATRMQRIGSVALKIEQLLLDEEATWDEWGELIDILNARSKIVFGNLKIKEIKSLYDRHQFDSRPTNNPGAEGQTG